MRSGDKLAFDTIYHRYIKLLYSYGTKITPDHALVEDCIQELFITLWTQRENLKETDTIKYYLFKALNRRIVRTLGKTRQLHLQDGELPQTYLFSLSLAEDPEHLADEERNRQITLLKSAIAKLTDRQREAIYLRYYSRLSYEEVAEILNLTVKGTYKLVARGLCALKELVVLLVLCICLSMLYVTA